MNKNNYIQLLYKKLNKSIEGHEKEDLDKWLTSSEDNQIIADSVEKSWELSEGYDIDVDLDFDADFTAVQRKIEKRNIQQPTAKVVKMQSKRWLSIAASIALLIAIGFLVNDLMNGSENWKTIQTAAGESENIMLADGTEVWVNENSTFSYSETFSGDYRFVKLKGEAFFDVSKNPNKPFVIQATRGKVKVLGTSFNVRDFATEETMEVHVKTGIVELRPNDSKRRLELRANESGIYNAKEGKMQLVADKNQNALAWLTHRLDFDNEKLQDVLVDIEKVYHVDIELLNTDMQNCSFTNIFKDTSLQQVLESVCGVLNMKVKKISATQYQLTGGACQ